jgi:hypothetical protein
MSDKYQLALIEYVKAKDAVSALSKRITVCIDNSRLAQHDVAPDDVPIDYLERAYMIDSVEEGVDEITRFYPYHDGDIVAYLTKSCQHALIAHLLIQERKLARKRLGVAKMRLTILGRNLMNAQSQTHF